MKLKHILISIILTSIPYYSNAQIELLFLDQREENKIHKQEIDFDFIYNYNTLSESQLYADIFYKNHLTKWVDIQAGFHSATNSAYALLAKANFKWNFKSHHNFEIRNQYLYNIFASHNSQSFNTLLAIAYSQKYYYMAFGASSQVIFPIYANGESTSVEPINFCYDIEGRIFPLTHNWNIGVQITNITPFLVERPHNPNFILKGNAKLIETRKERIDIAFKLGLEPIGLLKNEQYYELYFSAGIKCIL